MTSTMRALYQFLSVRCSLVSLLQATVLVIALTTEAANAQKAGEVFRDCDVCPNMVVVPPGSFMMGSDSTEEGRADNEGPQRRVTITYSFAVGVYEVTFDEWDACVRGGGCAGHQADDWDWGRGARPVIDVSWDDAWRYAEWLTERTGEEYRLLSEAEWEYVARAGTSSSRHWGETAQDQCLHANGYDALGHSEHAFDYKNPVGCRDRQASTGPVGSYHPNGFGLYDVLGNVAEWVDDCWNESHQGAATDGRPRYTGECSLRVLRGGAWIYEPRLLRSASRLRFVSDGRLHAFGFRVARTVVVSQTGARISGASLVTSRLVAPQNE